MCTVFDATAKLDVKRNVLNSGANVKLVYVLGGIFLYPPPGCLHNSHNIALLLFFGLELTELLKITKILLIVL